MCSRAGSLTRLALGLALALPLAAGCGHKENPKPPPQKIPQPIADLVVAQRGDELLFTFSYPQTTISGLPIDDVAAIELWEFEVAVPEFVAPAADEDEEGDEGEADVASEEGGTGEGEPVEESEVSAERPAEAAAEPAAESEPTAAEEEEDEEAAAEDEAGESEEEGEAAAEAEAEDDDEGDEDGDEGPAVAKETLLEVDPREFEAAAKRRLRLEGEELSQAISGDLIKLRLTLDKIEPGEKVGLVFGVRSFQRLDRASRFSNLFKIVPRVTPDPPAELEVEPVHNGVKISWTWEGDKPAEFRFYRRDSLAAAFDKHFGTQAGDSEQFLDSTAEFGRTYAYAMTAVVNQTPLVESALSPEQEIEYLDAFPPEAPADLVVLAEVGTARLLWEGSSDSDVAGYIIYRRTGTGEFERINERPVRAAEYSDTQAASGRVYAYRVVAVDRNGNTSLPSEEVEVRIP